MQATLRHPFNLVLLLAILGLSVRLGVALAGGITAAPEPGTDAYEYDRYAWNLANGNGYRGPSADVADPDHLTAYRPPFPSVLWAGIYLVVGDAEHSRHAAVRVVHCLLGAVCVVIVFGIGRECFNSTVGLVASAAHAFWPTSVQNSVQLLSEPLGVTLFLALIWTCLRFARSTTVKWALFAGLMLGLSLLTRPGGLFMVPLLGVWVLWQFRRPSASRLRTYATASLIPAAALLVMMPWVIRNYVAFGHVIPFSTMGGSVLLQGNNRLVVEDPLLYGYSVWDTHIPEYAHALQTAGNEIERDAIAKAFAVEWLQENPDQWLFLAQSKLRRAWTPFLSPESPALYRWAMLLTWGPVLVLTILVLPVTLWRFLSTSHPGWLLHLALLHHCVLSIVFFGVARYRLPVEPICLIFSAHALALLVTSVRRSTVSRPRQDGHNAALSMAGRVPLPSSE